MARSSSSRLSSTTATTHGSPSSSRSMLATALLCLTTTVAYIGIEYYAARAFTPTYSYRRNLTSELAVYGSFRGHFDGVLRTSPHAALMNYNFIQHAVLLVPLNVMMLIFVRRQQSIIFRILHIMIAAFQILGLALLAANPSSPHDMNSKGNKLHGLGAIFAILSGNVARLFYSVSAPKTWPKLYRYGLLACGSFGTAMVLLFFFVVRRETMGFWQRMAIYPITLSDLFTTYTLLTLALQVNDKTRNRKQL